MTSHTNRDWQTLSRRWSTWRWVGLCLMLSIGIHAGLGMLFEVPINPESDEAAGAPAAEETVRVSRPIEAKVVKAPPSVHVAPHQKKLLKQGLAAGPVREFFESLVGNLLPANEANALWAEMFVALSDDLNDLTDAVANSWGEPERPTQALANLGGGMVIGLEALRRSEAKLQHIKGRLLEAMLRNKVEQRNSAIESDLVAQVREIARLAAEQYRKDLVEKLVNPAGDQLNQLREKEAALRIKDLEYADAALLQSAPVARQAAQMLEALDSDVKTALDALQTAREKKENAAANKIAATLRDHRPTLSGASNMISKSNSNLRAAVIKLVDMPAIMANADEALKKFEAAQVDAYAALSATGNLEGDKLLAAMRKAVEQCHEAVAQTEFARAAIMLQLGREQAERLDETLSNQARHTAKIGLLRMEAEQAKDAAKLAEADRAADQAAREANLARELVENWQARLAKIEAAAKEAEIDLKALLTQAEEAKAELQQAETALLDKKTEAAVDSLKKAADCFGRLDADLMAAQKKLGVKNEANPATLARRQIDKMHREGKFARSIKEQFENYYRTQMKDKVLAKVEAGMMKRLQAEQADDPVLIHSIRAQVERELDRNLLTQVAVDEQVSRALDQKLPLMSGDPAAPPDDERTAAAAQQVVDARSSYAMNGVTSSIVSQNALYKLSNGSPKVGPPAMLLLRLQHLRQQLEVGRDEFLGQPDLAAVAALRHQLVPSGGAVNPVSRVPAVMLAPALETASGPAAFKDRLPSIANSQRFAAIPYRGRNAIRLDGQLDDWQGIPLLLLEASVEGTIPVTVKAAQQKLWVAHTSQGLLVAVDVIDTTGKIEADKPLSKFWTNDAVEVFLDPLNTKYPKRGGGMSHQLFAFPFGHKEDKESGGFEVVPESPEFPKGKLTAIPPDVIRRAAMKTKMGWSMEMLIPKSLLGRGALKPGQVIGFNIAIDTGTDTYYYFTAQKMVTPSQRPDTWGDLLLLGTNAQVELLDDHGARLAAICPGRPLRLRITDLDMNEDDAKVEKIGVMVRSRSGARETVVLEETAPDSGIFEANVPTRFSTGIRVPGVLDVLEGEPVTIEYLDRARADGTRNVRLQTPIGVASIGKRVGQ